MKKYYQLFLIITSVVSLTVLLVYRHEYNRLRYVLEVFNFFGQPNDCSFPDILNTTNVIQHDWGPVPVWTHVEDFYVYSAFLKLPNEVEALVVHNEEKIAVKSCFLWFDSENDVVAGEIKYTKIDQLDSKALYKYSCRANSVADFPYAVSFTGGVKYKGGMAKIMVNTQHKKKFQLTTACVAPSGKYSKQQVVEFISYHKIIGVDSFILYSDIPHKFMHTLEKLAPKLGVEIVNFPWNYPQDLRENGPQGIEANPRKVVEEDCLLRTADKSRNILVLNLNEFLVPRHHRLVSTMLDHYDPDDKTHRFALKTQSFCANFQGREPAIIRNVHLDETKSADVIIFFRNNERDNNVINTQEITTEVAAVHRYAPCKGPSSGKKVESVIMRFSSDLRKSTLFKLFKYDRL